MSKTKKVWVTGFLLVSLNIIFAADPTLEWAKPYNTGGQDVAFATALGDQNSIYIAGTSDGGTGFDLELIKYNAEGNVIWSRSFDHGMMDAAYDVAVDQEGYVYIAGGTGSQDCMIMKYTSQGDTVWTRFPGLPLPDADDFGKAVAVNENYVYVTGPFEATPDSGNMRTIAYDKNGVYVKEKTYDTPDFEMSMGIALDAAGNVYIAGNSGHDYRIIKYDSQLNELWNIPYDAGDVDRATGIAVDKQGLVFVTGSKGENKYSRDICTVCFDVSGNFRWVRNYDSGKSDIGGGIDVDDEYVYVSGSYIDSLNDITGFRTLCYDKDGNLVWNVLYPDTGKSTYGTDVAVDASGHVYVTGVKDQYDKADMLTLKYATETGVLERPKESPVSLEVMNPVDSKVTLRYSLPPSLPSSPSSSGTISFYSVSGRLVESFPLDITKSTFTWDARTFPSGVYFVRLDTGGMAKVARFIKIR